jgi:hypothetical protein
MYSVPVIDVAHVICLMRDETLNIFTYTGKLNRRWWLRACLVLTYGVLSLHQTETKELCNRACSLQSILNKSPAEDARFHLRLDQVKGHVSAFSARQHARNMALTWENSPWCIS